MSSSLGLLPTQALNAYMGSTFRSLEDVMSQQSGGYIVLFAQVLISILLMSYVIRRARRELNKTCEELENERKLNGQVVTTSARFLPKFLSKKGPIYDIEGQAYKEKPKNPKNKFQKGHRKSHSASAILVEVNEMSLGNPKTP